MQENDIPDGTTLSGPESKVQIDVPTNPFAAMRLLLDQAGQENENVARLRGYQFVRELGAGAMGAVGLIEHQQTNEQIALKVMLPQAIVNTAARERFLREIANTRALAHTHVVQLNDSGCWQDIFFYTMEYCNLGNLSQFVKKCGGQLELSEASLVILQILNALEYTHRAKIPFVDLKDGTIAAGQGLVHRDIKPQNILLTGSETAPVGKVSDYGLAKAFQFAGLSGKTATGEKGGSLCCMPRQQLIQYKYAKPEVDVWAAAACFYYMLTGSYPRDFPHPCLVTTAVRIIESTHPIPIRNRGIDIPAKLADLIDLALNDIHRLQFQSAADFKDQLEQIL